MLGRKSLLVLVARLSASVLALIGLMFTSRYLGPEVNGQISWALALITTFNSISDFGFSAAHIKRVSEGKDIADCVSTFTTVKLLLTGGMVVFSILYIIVWQLIDPGSIGSTDIYVLILIILYCVFYNISSIFYATFEARLESVKAQIVISTEPITRTPLMIFVALGGLGAVSLAFTYVVGGICLMLIGLLLFSRERIRWKKPTLFRHYLKYALPVSFIAVFGTVSWNLDKLIIEAFGSTTDVAFFSQPQTLLGVVGFIGAAVTSLTFPAFSRMHAQGDIQGIRMVSRSSERYISMLAMPITVVIVLFPMETVVTFLGELYSPAAEPMRILAIATYISLLSQAYQPQIGGTNRPDISAKLVGLSLALNTVLLFIFVPTTFAGLQMLGLGVNGACMVNVIVNLVFMILIRQMVYKLTKTRSNPRIFLHVFAGILSGLVLFLIFQAYPIQQWYDLLFYGLLEIPLFAGIMWILREFTRDDLRYFLDVMNLRDMASYISDEMKRND